MRLQYSLLELCLCFLPLNAHPAVEARHALLPRQHGPMPTQGPASVTATQSAFSESTMPDASRSAAAGTSLSHPSKTSSEPLKPAVSSDTSLTMDGSAMSTSPAPTSIYTPPDSASQPQSNDLPIVPAITPALSVGGAILMLTGPFYALVGIKNKWLHVFLSAAYLTSLAVTVLIIYVMHPPVSNAVQGAYLVAACMTGLIFGGGSLIFADITEALACLLGGFSLAMWFLVLVPGGLIRSTAGKAIFIGCFTLGSFGFYTSHWTRAYAIIGSTAFAGATVIVLGIDCFSRAGLKEFWLYIWHLNNNMFPLHYNGIYPITRGIRVEIAAIIICFLIGVMSQMKIWKVVKRRREEKATERLRHEKLQEEAEVAIGKEIEERNAQNRVLWESAYNSRHGNDRHVDSGISMTITNPRKGLSSTNILSQGVVSRASIELKELEGDDNITEGTSKSGPKDKTRAIVTVAVASDDENLGITSAPASVLNENQSLSPVEIGPSQESDPSLVKTEEVETDRLSSAPNAVPLPFEIPSSDSNADRRSSIAASLASDHFSTRVLNRLSGGSPRRASSQRSQRSYTAISTSEEAVMIPHDDEDDGTSSVAANVDEISDGQHSDADKTTSGILAPPDAEENKVRKSSPSIEAQPTDRPGHELSKDQASSPSAIGMDAEAPQAFIAKHEPIAGGEPSGLAKTPEDVLSCKEGQRSSSPTNSIEAKTPPASESAKAEPALRDRLADLSGTSKVMMVYRTNEWAKHLEDAEKPTMDDWIAEHSAVAIPTEKPAPINISALQQTALNASPAPVTPPPNLTQPPPITKPKHQSAYPNQQGPPNPYPSLQRKSSANPSFDRHPSHSSLNSLPSQRATRPPHPHRTSHPPLPIEEDVPSTTKHNRHSTPPNPQALSNPYPSLQHKLSSSIRHPSSSVRHASYSSLDTLPSQRTSYPPPLQTRPQQTRPSQTLHRSKYRRRASAPLLVHPPIEEGVPSTTFPDRGVTAPAFPINTTTTATRSNARVSQHLLTYTPNGMPVPSSHPTLHQHQHHPHHQQQQQQKRRQESYRGTAFMVPSSAYLPSPSTPSPSASAPALVGRRSASGKGLEERHREAMRRLQMRASFGG